MKHISSVFISCLALLVLLMLSSCGVRVASLPATLQVACKPGGGALQVRLPAPKIAFDCDNGKACMPKRILLRIVNCSNGPVSIKSIRHTNLVAGAPSKYKHFSIFDYGNKLIEKHRFLPRLVWLRLRERAQQIELLITTKEGTKIRWRSKGLETYNVAEQRCRDCEGIWKGTYCNCRTKDSNKICFDSSECQGGCVHTGFVVTRPGLCHPKPGATSVTFPMGYRVGRCSSHRYLRKRDLRYLDTTSKPRKPESLCLISVRRNVPGCIVRSTRYQNPWRYNKNLLQTQLPPYHHNLLKQGRGSSGPLW